MYPSSREQKLIDKFVEHGKPVFNDAFSIFPLAFVERDHLKWVIRYAGQRLRKWDGIAKDADVIEKRDPAITVISVLDIPDLALYTISVGDFDEHKQELITKSGGRQWMVLRKYWKREGLDGHE